MQTRTIVIVAEECKVTPQKIGECWEASGEFDGRTIVVRARSARQAFRDWTEIAESRAD
jgi:hypothetical protein